MDVVLASIMDPLARHFNEPDVVEVRMTQPGRIIIDRRGAGLQYVDDEALTTARIARICRALANKHGMPFDAGGHAKVSCIVPGVQHRFECLMGPSVQSGLSLTIRCKHPFVPTWRAIGAPRHVQEYLYEAMKDSNNIIISGATNTGKTTLLNMLLETVPTSRRVIGIEDTPELNIGRFEQSVGLVADRDSAGGTTGRADWQQLHDHCMRSTPDHIIFGEISTENAWAALAALNSGVTGFMCTIHAESTEQVLRRKFEQNIAWSGQSMSNINEYLAGLIDCIVQIRRGHDGLRRISEIYEPRKDNHVLGVPPESAECA